MAVRGGGAAASALGEAAAARGVGAARGGGTAAVARGGAAAVARGGQISMTCNVLPLHFAPSQTSSSQNSNVDKF